MPRSRFSSKNTSTANLGFEAKLWLAADKLRSNMDAAEYKHTVLGLIFLKYISDSFEEKHAEQSSGGRPERQNAALEFSPAEPDNSERITRSETASVFQRLS